MTTPSLFLRASEVGEKPTHLETGEVPRKPDLLVPQIRPGLEWVLTGGIFSYPKVNDGCITSEWQPVRAFEIIAGEEGRVRRPRELEWNPLDYRHYGREELSPFDAVRSWFMSVASHYQGKSAFGIEWRLGDEPVAQVTREEMGL